MNKNNVKIGTITLIAIVVGYVIYNGLSNSNYEKALTTYPTESQIIKESVEGIKNSLGYVKLENKKLSDKFNPKNGTISNLKHKKESEKELKITGHYTYKTNTYTYEDKIEIYYIFDGRKYKYNYATLSGEGSVDIYLTDCKESYKDKIKEKILEKYPTFTSATFKSVERSDQNVCTYNYTTTDSKESYDVTAKISMGCDPLGNCSYWINYDRSY